MMALALALAACNKEQDVRTPAKSAEGIAITATLAPKSVVTKAVVEDEDQIIVTWAENEHLAILYEVNAEKKAADATVTGVDKDGVATISFEVAEGTPDGTDCTIVYPFSAAKDDNSGVKDAATLLATQDGTLNAGLDVRVGAGTIDVTTPGLTVTTQPSPLFAIFKFSVKDAGSAVASLTSMTITTGEQDYVITLSSAYNHIFAALPPVSEQKVCFSATDSDDNIYFFSKDNVSFQKGYYYKSDLQMTKAVNLATLSANYVAQNGDILTGTLANAVKITIADNAVVTLNNANINGSGTWTNSDWAGITPTGNATLVLEGANSVKSFKQNYPGIFIPSGKTLTIQGSGVLNSTGLNYAAGIGGGHTLSCGNIYITGGTVTASGAFNGAGIGGGYKGACGSITITGGTITASSGYNACGIGSGMEGSCGDIVISGGTIIANTNTDGYSAAIGAGYSGSCGDITISNSNPALKVEASKGSGSTYTIGLSKNATNCGTVTIGGVEGLISTSPFYFPGQMAAEAVAGDVGKKLICTLGHIHAKDADPYCTAPRVAMVAYVGNSSGNCQHGLALALEDVSSNPLTWNNSGDHNDGKTAAEWCNVYNTSKTVVDATWMLPSKGQWELMYYGAYYGTSANLRSSLADVGGTNMDSEAGYWTSTEKTSGYAYKNSPSDSYYSSGVLYNEDKSHGLLVRAGLVF